MTETPVIAPESTSSEAGTPRNVGIVAENLVRHYGKWRVVNDVSIHVRQGEVVGLLGPNGAGKTTSFYMIVGLLRPTTGRILLEGEDITTEPMYLRARRGLGYLAQEPSIFRKLSVKDNVLAVLETMKLCRRIVVPHRISVTQSFCTSGDGYLLYFLCETSSIRY